MNSLERQSVAASVVTSPPMPSGPVAQQAPQAGAVKVYAEPAGGNRL
jgi:hypothetical protein